MGVEGRITKGKSWKNRGNFDVAEILILFDIAEIEHSF